MTPADLRAWQKAMGISGREAARRLGVAPGTYQDWVTGTSRTTGKPIQISRLVALACAALAAGVGEWTQLEHTMNTTPFPNLFNAAREMIAERLEIIRNDKHGLYTHEDLESAEREQALIELEIAQVEAGWSTR